jgi:CRP-like cAMP-binding protein
MGQLTTAPPERYRVNLMDELPPASMAALERIGTRRRYNDNQFVQHRGDAADHALVVISGRVRTLAYLSDGTEQLMRWMEVGEISGLSSVVGNAPVPVDLVADGPAELLALPREPLLELLAKDGRTCLVLVRLLSLRVNELHEFIFTRAGDTLGARVWGTLQRLARVNGEPLPNGRIGMRMSQEDLAHVVGASRQRVNEELRQLQAEGKVLLGYRRMEIAMDAAAPDEAFKPR